MERFRHWFVPPLLEEPDRKRLARALSLILHVSAIGSILLFINVVSMGQTYTFLPLISFIVIVGISIALIRIGNLILPSYLIPTAALIGVTVELMTGNGIHDLGVLFYPVIVVFAALLLGKYIATLFAILSTLSAAWIVHLEITGELDTPFSGQTAYQDLLTIIVVQVLILVVFWVIQDNLSKSLQSARQAEAEIRELNAELEDRVRERTLSLEDANQDLESFTYTVSHDLMAPVRAIRGFSGMLKQDYGDSLSLEARHNLDIIDENAEMMSDMISGLLAFSKLSRQSVVKQEVDMRNLVIQVLRSLSGDFDMSAVDMVIGDIPPAQGDPQLLFQVWLNLISNAVKFTRNTDSPMVEIGSRSEYGAHVYFVRDNGPGFSASEAEKIFGVFQRLQRSKEYEGAGVGLAIVRRIVNRHGGKAWAEAVPGHGATIFFTLEADLAANA